MGVQLSRDTNSSVTFGLSFPKDSFSQTQSLLLTASTEALVTIPNVLIKPNQGKVIQIFFSYSIGNDVWVGLDLAAPITIPASPVPDLQLKELNPAVRYGDAGGIIHLISPTNSTVNIVYRSGY